MFINSQKKPKTCIAKQPRLKKTLQKVMRSVKRSATSMRDRRIASQLLLPLAASALFTACTSVPKNLSDKTEGTFKSKVLIRDLKKNKSYVVNAKFQAHLPDKTRLDITSPVGQHLFTLVTHDNEVEYLAIKDKQHVKTKANATALSQVIPININPTRLANVFFESPIDDKNWSCTKKDGVLDSCKEMGTKITIAWEMQPDGKRRVKINQPGKAEIQINVYEFEDKVNRDKNPFALETPKSFKVYTR